jgi:haloalkane dehalogenase
VGGSDKPSRSSPDRYHYFEQRDYLFALWDALDLGDDGALVLHDCGGVLGFDWANQYNDRVAGIAFTEAVVVPMKWDDCYESARGVFQRFPSPDGERMVLEHNLFVEAVLLGAIHRRLTDEEMEYYRRPFAEPGGGHRQGRALHPGGQPRSDDIAAAVAQFVRGLRTPA